MQKDIGIVPKPLPGSAFLIGRFSVQPALNRVCCGTEITHLEPKAMQLLVFMVEHSGEVLSREVLLNAVWGDAFVTDQVLSNAISQIRYAFGDEGKDYIQTIPKSGYLLSVHPISVNGNGTDNFVDRGPGCLSDSVSAVPQLTEAENLNNDAEMRRRRRRKWFGVALGTVLVAAIAVATYIYIEKPPKIHSVAVLPLENLSGDPEQEYLVDGIHDGLTSTLGRVGSLDVRSRTSAMHYRNTDKTVPQIARELKVDAVLEGSVRRSGKRLSITLQLIEAATDRQLWSKTYERDLTDVLQTENEIVSEIANEINATLTPAERSRFASARVVDPEAYDWYLKGKHNFNSNRHLKAMEAYSQAVRLDPNFAEAYLALGRSYMGLPQREAMPPSEAMPKAIAAIKRAVELDPDVEDAHGALGTIKARYDYDWQGAEWEFRRQLELNPNTETNHMFYGCCVLVAQGKFEEGIEELRRARDLLPAYPYYRSVLGFGLYLARRNDDAIRELLQSVGLDEKLEVTHEFLGMAYSAKGMHKEAIRELERANELNSVLPVGEFGPRARTLGRMGYVYAAAGERKRALSVLEELKKMSETRYVASFFFAIIHAQLGNKDEALAYLEKAYDERCIDMAFLKVDPRVDTLRSDAQFRNLLHRMNLE